MQRNFSVDDILGTFWKLDTQGDTQKSPVVSIPEEDEDSSIILPPVVDSLKVIEVDKGMNRSASEYAFQEFLKVSEERGGSAAVRKSRFMVNQRRKVPEDEDDEEDDDDDDDHEDDDDDDDDEHDDEHDNTDPPSPESPETFETKMEQQPSRQETHDLNEHPRSLSPPPPPPASAPSSTSSTPVGLGSIGGVVDQVEVGVALNPLFSGLRDEVETAATATNSPQEYEYFLKHKLDLACAAVALSRGSAGGANIGPPALPANYTPPGYGGLNLLGPIGIPALPPKPEFGSPVAPTRAGPVTSGSDGSEDDDPDELGQNVAPGDLKRVKRMLSNRESARRSRRRKQAHLSELESQVAHLRVENTTIMKRLSEITIKFQEAAIENRVLKSDVATLQAKLKMAENVASGNNGSGQAGSMDGLNPNLRYMMPYTTGGNIQHYTQQARQTPVVQQQQEQQQVSTGKMGRTPSMQRVASLEHLQKRICKGAACGPGWGGWEVEGPSMVENHDD